MTRIAIIWGISITALLAAPAFGQPAPDRKPATIVEELPGGIERPVNWRDRIPFRYYTPRPGGPLPPNQPSNERYSVFVSGAGEGPVDWAGKEYGRR